VVRAQQQRPRGAALEDARQVLALGVALATGGRAASTPSAAAQEVPKGRIVDDVRCEADASQSYALYVPSSYTPEKAWSLLLAFHPGARGRVMVEKYLAPAERYGYIVAGSNTSRNGPWEASGAAVRCMSRDLGRRFAIDAQRLYLTGHSGGARLAMQVALGPANPIAGVIASSAGFPDARPRARVPFAVFATAGTEDFNYVEMQLLDRTLSSPHRLAVFEGGHALPPDDVAVDAIEWLELQAMASGRRERDDALVTALYDKRLQRATAANPVDKARRLRALVDDFTGLRDVSAAEAAAKALSLDDAVRTSLARERSDVDAEVRMLDEVLAVEARLHHADRRAESLHLLEARLSDWSRTAGADEDSPARRQARRLLAGVGAGGRERAPDPEYRRLLDRYAPRRGGPPAH